MVMHQQLFLVSVIGKHYLLERIKKKQKNLMREVYSSTLWFCVSFLTIMGWGSSH